MAAQPKPGIRRRLTDEFDLFTPKRILQEPLLPVWSIRSNRVSNRRASKEEQHQQAAGGWPPPRFNKRPRPHQQQHHHGPPCRCRSGSSQDDDADGHLPHRC